MNNLKPWYALDIDVDSAVNKSFDFDQLLLEANTKNPSLLHTWYFNIENLTKVLSTHWLDYMKSIDIPVQDLLVFHREPGYLHPTAHIDLPYRAGTKLGAALNWCIGPDDAEMVWYHMPASEGTYDITEADSNYREWPLEELTECSRRTIGSQCTIVQVDVPHNVVMNTYPRWLISARTQRRIDDWADAVKFVEPFIIG
jgi:hypothetical protein